MPRRDAESDPCFYEGQASLKCVLDSNGDKSKCSTQFDSYNKCKQFWGDVSKARRIAKLQPFLPPLKDRPAFLRKYVETKKIPVSVDDINSS